jgi:hypothetical protein
VSVSQLRREFVPISTVPKITVAKDGNALAAKNNIRLARQPRDILAIT